MRKKRRFLLQRTHNYANMAVSHGGRRPGVPAAKKERARTPARAGPTAPSSRDSRHVQRTRPPRVGPARHHTARHRTPFHCHRIITLFVDPIPRDNPPAWDLVQKQVASPARGTRPGSQSTATPPAPALTTKTGEPGASTWRTDRRRLADGPARRPRPPARSRSARRPKAVRS